MKAGRFWKTVLLATLLTSPAAATTYTVKAGDTLYSLARSVGLTVAQLQALNGLTGTDLKAGQVLRLPDVSAPVLPLPAAPLPANRPAAEPANIRITRSGCCAHAVWTADGAHLLYLDRPAGREVGVYSVPAAGGTQEGTWRLPPTLLSESGRYGLQPTGPSAALAVRLGGSSAATPVIVATSGRDAVWSAGGRLAWPAYGTANRNDWIPLTVWTTDPFGGEPRPTSRRSVTVYGGRLVGWVNEGTLLLTGRQARNDPRRSVLTVDLASGKTRVLAQGQVLSGVRLSADGMRVLFRVTLDTAGHNGMFAVPTSGGDVQALPAFGSARWLDGTRALLVPYEPGAASQRLLRVDVTTGQTAEVTSLSDKIAGDDWRVAPDGTRLVYLSGQDRALHVLTLPLLP